MTEAEMLSKILSGNIDVIPMYDHLYDKFNSECKVLINPQQVKEVLYNYLNKNIISKNLQLWADFICLCSGLKTPMHANEDYYDNMWDVLLWISMSPIINGEITPEKINEYVALLDKNYVVVSK